MEIRKFSDIIGVVTTEAIYEGRFVLLVPALANSSPFGLEEDLAGVKMPTSGGEAALAKYVLGWAMDNRPLPLLDPMPAYNWIVRNYGFEAGQRNPNSDNTPITGATLYLSYPSQQHMPLEIPSGYKALAYAGGVYTFPSGTFVDSANIKIVGNLIAVEATDGGADQGKPQYDASGTIGVVEEFNTTDYSVTIRTLVP